MNKPKEHPTTARPVCWLWVLPTLLAAFGLALSAGPGHAHEGHDSAPAQATVTDPSLVVRSAADDHYEVVLKYRSVPGSKRTLLQVFVSDFATNAPVEHARVLLRTTSPTQISVEATADQPGVYGADLVGAKPGDYTMILSIEGTFKAEFALSNLPVGKAPAPATGGTPAASARRPPTFMFILLGLAAVIVIGALVAWSRRRANRRGARIVQAALLVAAGLLLWSEQGAAHAGHDQAPTAGGAGPRFVPKESQFLLGVRTALVRQEPLHEQLTAIGHVVPESGALAAVSAPQAGRLELAGRALVIGDRVRQGQLLGYLLVIDRLPIRAPISGLISEQDFVPGQWVQAGQQLARILDERRMRVEVPLFGENLSKALQARVATVHTNALPDRHFAAKVRGLAPTASTPEQGSGSQAPLASAIPPIILTVENTGGLLRPGMLVDVSIESPRLETVLSVPASAIVYQESGPGVFIHTGAELFEYRAVGVAGRYGERVGIAGSVKPGERVVTEGAYTLVSAAPVSAPAPVAAAGGKK